MLQAITGGDTAVGGHFDPGRRTCHTEQAQHIANPIDDRDHRGVVPGISLLRCGRDDLADFGRGETLLCGSGSRDQRSE